MRPSEPDRFRQRKKNDGSDPPGSHARSRPTDARHLQRSPQDGPTGSGSHRDGCALGPASSRRSSVDRTAALPGPACRTAHPSLSLRPTSPLPGTTFQARPDGRGQGGGVAPLLPVPALPCRPVSCRCRTGHRKHGIISGSAPHAGPGRTGGSLRPRAPADEAARRSGGDHQSRGAHGGSDRRRYRRRRAAADPASRPVGSADRGR